MMLLCILIRGSNLVTVYAIRGSCDISVVSMVNIEVGVPILIGYMQLGAAVQYLVSRCCLALRSGVPILSGYMACNQSQCAISDVS